MIRLRMWMLTLVGLNIIANVHGYANGYFPESCDSMLPQHSTQPQTSDPPFEVTCEHGSPEEPLKVTLRGKESSIFIGFMLQARNASLDGEGPAVGKFTLLPTDRNSYRLLTCNGSENSAVSQALNHDRTTVTVLWTPVGTEKDIIFRATFLQRFRVFWQNVNVSLTQCSSPPKPATTEPTAATTTLPASSSTPIPLTNSSNFEKRLSIAMMTVGCVVEEVKWKGYNINVMFSQMLFNHHLRKVGMIVCSSILILLDISFFSLYLLKSKEVPFAALVSVLIVINIAELVIVLLPINPSHELRDIRDHVLGGCFVLHQIFAIAAIFVGVSELKNDSAVFNEIPWIFISVLTVWIVVSGVWSVVVTTQKRRIMQRSKRGKAKHSHSLESQMKRSPDAAKVIVIVVSAILLVGTICFAIPIMVALLNLQDD